MTFSNLTLQNFIKITGNSLVFVFPQAIYHELLVVVFAVPTATNHRPQARLIGGTKKCKCLY